MTIVLKYDLKDKKTLVNNVSKIYYSDYRFVVFNNKKF